MEFFFTRFAPYGLLLTCLFWSVTDCAFRAPRATPATTPPPIPDVNNIVVVNQTETTITITFDKVPGVPEYVWYYFINGTKKNESFQADVDNFTLHGLLPAQTYSMTLRSRLSNGDESPGRAFKATTAPENVDDFRALTQTPFSILLWWAKKAGVVLYILEFNGNETTITANDTADFGAYHVDNLNSDTQYTFTLYCEFEGIRSTGISLTTFTTVNRDFQRVSGNETSITLQWNNDDPLNIYTLECNEMVVNFTSQELSNPATYTFTGLQAATRYTVSLATERNNTLVDQVFMSIATAPQNAEGFKPVGQTETSITLSWELVPNVTDYILQSVHGEISIREKNEATVTNLASGTFYNFTLFAVFDTFRSSGSSLTAATAPQNAEGFKPVGQNETSITLSWEQAPDVTDYILQSVHGEISIRGKNEAAVTNLASGTFYNFTLFVEFNNVRSSGSRLTAATVPSSLTAKCKNCNGGYSLCVEWDRPSGAWEYVEITVSDKVFDVGYNGELYAKLPNFQPAKKYQVSISSRVGPHKSEPYVFTCTTDARGVIVGAVFGVLLFALLVGAVVFVMLRRSGKISWPKKSPKGGAENSDKKMKMTPTKE